MFSYYRAKTYTNADIKGAFTEARDDLGGTVFRILQRCAENKAGLDVQTITGTPDGDCVVFTVGGLCISISDQGIFEIYEGAA